MKIRSLFLCTCLIVVPVTALVTHRLPGGVVQAAGGLLSAVLGEAEHDATPGAGADVESEVEPPDAVAWPQDVPTTSPVAAVTAAPATEQGDLQFIRQRLSALGAVSFDCRPLPGGAPVVVATCRVGVDAEGSLFRMFQASGSDPSSACRELLAAVERWRARPEVRSVNRPLDPQVGR